MKTLSLNGAWSFRENGHGDWMNATVPGCNYQDLLELNKIPNPFIGENESKTFWVGERDWEYKKTFTVDESFLKSDETVLQCEMLDTLCDVFINDILVGHGENAHIAYEFDVKEALKSGENTVRVVFYSPVQFVRNACKTDNIPGNSQSIRGMTHIRKAQCHFGWDWGPKIPISGITRPIRLASYNKGRIDDIRINQKHEDGTVDVTVKATAKKLSDASLNIRCTLLSPSGEIILEQTKSGEQADFTFNVQNPELWWTNDISPKAEQPLYTVVTEVLADEEVLDKNDKKLGLRTIVLNRSDDEWGSNFQFILNGVPLFCKGGDYIPPDSLITRFTEEDKLRLLKQCLFANMNMVRVWGGGYYESDEFYDNCDKLGILVWQDFMFACAPYPFYDEKFYNNVAEEITYEVKRLRHHASLALWCGNNEVEAMAAGWASYRRLIKWTEIFFYHRLPELVSTQDNVTPFINGSPSGSGYMKNLENPNYGDGHHWQVWHGLQPLTFYRKLKTRFCSEFGLESMPSQFTVDYFSKPEEQQLTSKVFLAHQKSPSGNQKMLFYIASRYRLPNEFKDLLYLSQMIQLEGVRDAVEHWRRFRGRCNGALYWQLNDCWPVNSWAGIDYFGRFKALHYGARRFNEPVMVSVEDTEEKFKVFLVNDTTREIPASLRCRVMDFSGNVLRDDEKELIIKPTSSECTCEYSVSELVSDKEKNKSFFVAEIISDGEIISRRVILFNLEKHLNLPEQNVNAQVKVNGKTCSITLKSDTFVKNLFVDSSYFLNNCSDNFFDLLPNEEKTITAELRENTSESDLHESLRLQSVNSIRNVKSISAGTRTMWRVLLQPVNFVTYLYRRITTM